MGSREEREPWEWGVAALNGMETRGAWGGAVVPFAHPSNQRAKSLSPRLCPSQCGNGAGVQSVAYTCPGCGFGVESMRFCKALPLPLPPLYIICGSSGNVRKPQMGHSIPHPSLLSRCQDGGRLSVYHYIPEALVTGIVSFLHLAGPCGRPGQQSVPQTGEYKGRLQPAALLSPLCCLGHSFPGLEGSLVGLGLRNRPAGLSDPGPGLH